MAGTRKQSLRIEANDIWHNNVSRDCCAGASLALPSTNVHTHTHNTHNTHITHTSHIQKLCTSEHFVTVSIDVYRYQSAVNSKANKHGCIGRDVRSTSTITTNQVGDVRKPQFEEGGVPDVILNTSDYRLGKIEFSLVWTTFGSSWKVQTEVTDSVSVNRR